MAWRHRTEETRWTLGMSVSQRRKLTIFFYSLITFIQVLGHLNCSVSYSMSFICVGFMGSRNHNLLFAFLSHPDLTDLGHQCNCGAVIHKVWFWYLHTRTCLAWLNVSVFNIDCYWHCLYLRTYRMYIRNVTHTPLHTELLCSVAMFRCYVASSGLCSELVKRKRKSECSELRFWWLCKFRRPLLFCGVTCSVPGVHQMLQTACAVPLTIWNREESARGGKKGFNKISWGIIL